MYGKTTSDGSKNTTAPKGLTALLIGLIVCYQVVNYCTLFRSPFPEEGGHDADAACAAAPGAGGASSLCMEARLFRGWHEMPTDSPAELEQLLAISPRRASESTAPTTSSAPAPRDVADAPPSMRGQGGGSKNAAAEAAEADGESIMKAKPAALEGTLWDLAFKLGGGDEGHSPPEKKAAPRRAAPSMRGAAKARKGQHKTPFTEELVALQQQLEAKMQAQARKHAEHKALRALSVAARGTGQSSEAPSEDDRMTPWAHGLDDLTHELQDHMEARRKARAEHAAAHAAKLAAARATVHAAHSGARAEEGSHPLLDEIQTLGLELCKDPSRHNLPVCAQFVQSQSTSAPADHLDAQAHQHHQDAHQNAMAHIKLLEKHLGDLHKEAAHDDEVLKQESTEVLRELCSDPARSSYPACAKLLAESRDASPPAPASAGAPRARGLRGGAAARPRGLRWPTAKEWEARVGAARGAQHADTAPVLFFRRELRGAHWEGKMPKVACVTVLPQGQVTETLMRYFMDNYALQDYDGPRQLAIVYHNKDREAARIAHLYADGETVLAAAARGEGEFPSATAFRFGAWLAHDADAVARWDFDAWHHPHRLTMQVRSMIIGQRPASVVSRVTVFDAAGGNTTKLGGTGPHGSMMGEAAWMRKHWMPLLEEESSVLLGVQARHLVQVDMPELLAYHDAPPVAAAPA